MHGKAINELNVDHESELKNHEANTIDRLREQERELRKYQQRMFYERNGAAEEVAELAEQCDELNVTLERLRRSSKNGLLAQVAELQAKVRQLGARRTLNQRTLSDANLSDRRTKASEAKASRYQQALDNCCQLCIGGSKTRHST